jgi:protein-tyrosine phosphatase
MALSVTSVRRRWLDSLARMGGFDRHAAVDWRRVRRLVFVCKGNVCRSVYAERKSISSGLSSISAGLETRGGTPANESARRVAALKGIDLGDHATQQFTGLVLDRQDLVVAMEPWHVRRASEHERSQHWQLTLGGLWLNPKRAVIPDPYGEDDEVFENTFLLLDELVSRLANEMR